MPEISFRDNAAAAGDGVYFVVSRAGEGQLCCCYAARAQVLPLAASVLQDASCLRSAFGKNAGV